MYGSVHSPGEALPHALNVDTSSSCLAQELPAMEEDGAVVSEQVNHLAVKCLINVISVLVLKTSDRVDIVEPGEFVLDLGELRA